MNEYSVWTFDLGEKHSSVNLTYENRTQHVGINLYYTIRVVMEPLTQTVDVRSLDALFYDLAHDQMECYAMAELIANTIFDAAQPRVIEVQVTKHSGDREITYVVLRLRK